MEEIVLWLLISLLFLWNMLLHWVQAQILKAMDEHLKASKMLAKIVHEKKEKKP